MQKIILWMVVASLFVGCATKPGVDAWGDSALVTEQQRTITEQQRIIDSVGQQLGQLRQLVESAGSNNQELREWALEHRKIEQDIITELRRLEEVCGSSWTTDAGTGSGSGSGL